MKPQATGPRVIAGVLVISSAAAWLLGAAACGSASAPSPFVAPDAGGATTGTGGGGSGGGGELGGSGGGTTDPTLGGPCTKDEQCNDGVDCTVDLCDVAIERCRFTPDDSACQNGLYCDGIERCDQKLGCRAGEPVGCSDTTVCTIDACDEATDLCTHEPRDADQDGDPDLHCAPGGDCDDDDPTRSSILQEVCANLKDDDCDGAVDEADCTTAEHDTCADPLVIDAPGTYAMNTTGAVFNYGSPCAVPNQAASHDVVAAIVLPAGPLMDVEVTARSPWPSIAATMVGQCGDLATLVACGTGYPSAQGGLLAKLRGRSVGSLSESTAYPLYVATDQPTPITVDVQFLPPTEAPTNETCGTALPIVPGVPVVASLLGTLGDVLSSCGYNTGDLFYTFTLDAPHDVDVYAASLDGDGLPSVSLRKSGCSDFGDEITCQIGLSPHVFWQALQPGTYFVGVGATAPTDVSVTLELSPPSPPKPDENCVGSPVLAPNHTIPVDLAGHQDDVSMNCFGGAVDAAYQLDLPVASDVLLVERISAGDTGAIELASPTCDPPSLLACVVGAPSPVRSSKHNVPAGEYRVVAESYLAKPIEITALVRPAVAPVLVPFADTCADAVDIPETGGLFQGTTANATADYNAGCDQGNLPQGGAKEQMLRLVLGSTKRVVLDMGGSPYTTLLDVRQGPVCPGEEVVLGCGVGYYAGRSYLDLVLDAGTYYVQIDGFNLEQGPWFLDVHVVDP